MKLSITTKLFAAVLATAIAVAVAMGVAAHISLNRGFLGYLNEQAVQRLDQALPGVAASYRANGSWEFLQQRPELWHRILRPVPGDDGTKLVYNKPPPTVSELTGATRRFTLFDAQRRRIAGFDGGPALNAVERAVVVDGRTVGWLTLAPFESVSSAAERRFEAAQTRSLWAVGLGAVLLAAAVAAWASRRLLTPVRQVAAATHRLAAGDYETRVEPISHDEVGQLAADFNRLAHTLQRNELMRREFMADVSHELRTPLGVLHGELEALEDGVRSLDRDSLRSLQAEVATLNKLVNDLYELSLADVGALAYRKADIDLATPLRLTAGIFGERLAARGLCLELDLPEEPLTVFADERRLQQLFNNLLENSCRYTDAGGLLRITARADAGLVRLDVMDSAPGVDGEHLARIFDRFFRAEHSRNRSSGGAGLGLTLCQRIVEAHDGHITARASPLGGLWMAISLPRAASA
ncbi:MAG TPA: ATP-binding protein [Roseateles sp.]|nr:ATP-binding protein [Roseateles sp.]